MIKSVFYLCFYINKFSEKVDLPYNAFYIGFLVGLHRKKYHQIKKTTENKTKEV